MRHLLRLGLAGALLLLTPGAALAAKAPPRPTPRPAPTPPKSPTAPRSSGHVAYVGANGNIFVVRPDGTDKRALTNNSAADPAYNAPLLSPKGAGVLAVRFAAGLGAFKGSDTAGLWLIPSSGSGAPRRLTTNVPRGYAWAPDGASIVYEEGYLSETSLVVLDPRTGHKRTLPCDPAFRLAGVTPIGNRAVGVQGSNVVAESLADGTTGGLTDYGSNPKAGVWQGLIAVSPNGGAVLYAEAPGTTLVSIDLRSRRSVRTSLPSTASNLAPSSDTSTYAYAMSGTAGGAGATQVLLRVGKNAASVRGASFTPHAFAPSEARFVYTSGDGYVYVAQASCAASCATRLGVGRDADWGA